MSAAVTEKTGVAGRMSLPETREPARPATAAAVSTAPAVAVPSYAELQRLVDLAANFHLRTVAVAGPGGPPGRIASMRLQQTVHRMVIRQQWPDAGGMRSQIVTAAAAGTLRADLHFIGPDAAPRPDRDAAAVEWDRQSACRFVIPHAEVDFGSGSGRVAYSR